MYKRHIEGLQALCMRNCTRRHQILAFLEKIEKGLKTLAILYHFWCNFCRSPPLIGQGEVDETYKGISSRHFSYGRLK